MHSLHLSHTQETRNRIPLWPWVAQAMCVGPFEKKARHWDVFTLQTRVIFSQQVKNLGRSHGKATYQDRRGTQAKSSSVLWLLVTASFIEVMPFEKKKKKLQDEVKKDQKIVSLMFVHILESIRTRSVNRLLICTYAFNRTHSVCVWVLFLFCFFW